jgi:hypothetical protein
VLEGQKVPNEEKLFSIFEPHTQLYKRGKPAEPVQFGRQVLIYEDGAGFITHAYLLPRDAEDRDVVVDQTRRLQERLGGRIRRACFGRLHLVFARPQHLLVVLDFRVPIHRVGHWAGRTSLPTLP